MVGIGERAIIMFGVERDPPSASPREEGARGEEEEVQTEVHSQATEAVAAVPAAMAVVTAAMQCLRVYFPPAGTSRTRGPSFGLGLK